MSDEIKTTQGSGVEAAEQAQIPNKGKGKAPSADTNMDDDSSSEEEDQNAPEEQEEGDEDNMEEIDESNIISGGRRTRGKAIDFAKAAEGLDDDDEEDEDEDFEDPDNEMQQ